MRYIVCPLCCRNRPLNEHFYTDCGFRSFVFDKRFILHSRTILGGRNPDGSYGGRGFKIDEKNSMTMKQALNDPEVKKQMDEILEFCNDYIAYYKKINKEK